MNENFCPNCKEEVSQIEFECSNCKFPLSGTEKEKSIFIGKQIANKSKISSAKENQGKTRRILFVVAFFQFFNGFISIQRNYPIETITFYFVLGAILCVFAYFSTKKPLLFLSLSLLVILGYYFILYLSDPELIFRGILWKVVIVSFLIYGIVQSLQEQKLKKENGFLR